MEKYDVYLKKFKIALAIFIVGIAAFIFLIVKTVPEVQKILETEKSYKTQVDTLADLEKQLASLKETIAKEKKEDSRLVRAIFKPISVGLDTESAIADEFGEILQTMRENKVKARSIKYDYDPQDDNFVKNVPNRFYVCRVSMDLVATYQELENFIRDLFKHEHFLEISKVEITPYQKNKRVLIASLQIKLFAMKDASAAPSRPAKASNDNEAKPNEEGPANIEQK